MYPCTSYDTTRPVQLCRVIYAYSKATMIVSLISYCGEKIPLQTTVSVQPHTVNPLDAELYTAAVFRPWSPGRTVHSNASVNQQLLLQQHARETRAGCV